MVSGHCTKGFARFGTVKDGLILFSDSTKFFCKYLSCLGFFIRSVTLRNLNHYLFCIVVSVRLRHRLCADIASLTQIRDAALL